MGTSKGYIPPKGYLWRDAQLAVTNMAKNNFDSESIAKGLKKYSEARRNTNDGSQQHNQQVVSSGTKVMNFINLLNNYGLDYTLENLGLHNLMGKDNQEIFMGLVDYFSPEADSIEDNIVRDCVTEILNEVDIFDSEGIISDKELLQKFLITYVQKSFITNFFEKIQGLCGNINKTNKAIDEIKNNIRITLQNDYSIKDLTDINWMGREGKEFMDKTCNEAFEIFILMEGY
ncbi:hypothetical protein [Tissierella praeacuta]|uniref:hypothetical protein n=1 Tax=Tissierella praeacuta TaxID=43131 RepID=UPI0028AE294F|nr:hypothetical protein [Tissierella praeacuta]